MEKTHLTARKTVAFTAAYVVLVSILLLLPYLLMARTDQEHLRDSVAEIALNLAQKGKFRSWDEIPSRAVVQRIVPGKMFALAEGHFYANDSSCPFTVVLWKNLFSDSYRVDGRYCISAFCSQIDIVYLPMKASLTNGLQELTVKTAFDIRGCAILLLLAFSNALLLRMLQQKKKRRKTARILLSMCALLVISSLLPYSMKSNTAGNEGYFPITASDSVKVESKAEGTIHFPDSMEGQDTVLFYNQLFPLLKQTEAEPDDNWKYRITVGEEAEDFEILIFDAYVAYNSVCFVPLEQVQMEEILSAAENQYYRANR